MDSTLTDQIEAASLVTQSVSASDAAPYENEFSKGWPVLLASTVGVGLGTTGLAFFSFGQFVRPIAHSFGWSRAEVSGGIMCLMLGVVFTAPIIGRAVDRYGYRAIGISSQVGLALGYILVSMVGPSLIWYYASWLALSVLGCGSTPIVWSRAVTGHFVRRRGLALGIMLSGTGIIAILAPLVVSQMIAHLGWPMAYRGLAAILLFVGLPISVLFLRGDRPKDSAAAPLEGISVGAAIRTSAFWRLIAAFFLVSVGAGGFIVHLPAMMADRGMSVSSAATLVAFLGYTIIIGRLALGFMVDRFRPALVGAALLSLSAMSSLLFATGSATLVGVLLLGLCCGAEVDLLAFLVSRLFGLRNYAQIYGFGISAFTAGSSVGSVVAGRCHDLTGSYTIVLYVFACLIAVATALIASLDRSVNGSAYGRVT